jgi:MFS transporter, CP family, cyanate transporter
MMANTATESSAAAPEVTAQPRRGLWRGRAAILIGLVLLGIGLRHAVTLLSPLLGEVREALGLGTAGATFLGMLPTLCFGAAGFLAPVLARQLGAEVVALMAVALAAAGTLVRPFTDSAALFMALTTVALVGMGFGNVVGAPLVKRYFPDRQATMITVFLHALERGRAAAQPQARELAP